MNFLTTAFVICFLLVSFSLSGHSYDQSNPWLYPIDASLTKKDVKRGLKVLSAQLAGRIPIDDELLEAFDHHKIRRNLQRTQYHAIKVFLMGVSVPENRVEKLDLGAYGPISSWLTNDELAIFTKLEGDFSPGFESYLKTGGSVEIPWWIGGQSAERLRLMGFMVSGDDVEEFEDFLDDVVNSLDLHNRARMFSESGSREDLLVRSLIPRSIWNLTTLNAAIAALWGERLLAKPQVLFPAKDANEVPLVEKPGDVKVIPDGWEGIPKHVIDTYVKAAIYRRILEARIYYPEATSRDDWEMKVSDEALANLLHSFLIGVSKAIEDPDVTPLIKPFLINESLALRKSWDRFLESGVESTSNLDDELDQSLEELNFEGLVACLNIGPVFPVGNLLQTYYPGLGNRLLVYELIHILESGDPKVIHPYAGDPANRFRLVGQDEEVISNGWSIEFQGDMSFPVKVLRSTASLTAPLDEREKRLALLAERYSDNEGQIQVMEWGLAHWAGRNLEVRKALRERFSHRERMMMMARILHSDFASQNFRVNAWAVVEESDEK